MCIQVFLLPQYSIACIVYPTPDLDFERPKFLTVLEAAISR